MACPICDNNRSSNRPTRGHSPSHVDRVAVPYGRPARELQALATGGGAERWVAVVALAHSADSDALPCLGNLATAPDAHLRRFALEWLGRRGDGAQLGDVVVRGLADSHQVVVRTAADVAAELNLPQAHAAVLTLLSSESPATRTAGLLALAALWQPDDFAPTLDRFLHDPSQAVQREAGWTLRKNASATYAAVLFDLWRVDPLPRHRVWACEVALAYPEQRYRNGLVQLEADADGHVREAARRAGCAADR